MKMKISEAWNIKLAMMVGVVCFVAVLATTSHAQIAGAPRVVVEAIQGDATVTTGTEEEPQRLGIGSTVNAWNMVNTNGSSKLFLRWGTGLFNSLGEFSSMFLSSIETPSGPMDSIQVTEGVLRVTRPSGGGPSAPYAVTTPSASIEPANYGEPIDFMVEVYSPQTSLVTVISGRVKVRNTTLSQPVETFVDPCQSVYVDEGKSDLDVLVSTAADLSRLVANTTIPDTIPVSFQCAVPPGPPSVAQPSVVPQYVQYEYEDWESYDIYPYNEITVLPPEPGIGCVVILPGIGRWIIPIEVFAGWRFDPAIIGVYCRHIILDHVMYRDHYYLADARLRQKQLRHLIYLAQLSGNRSMLLDAQRQLTDLNVQSRWATMRLNRLEQKVGALDQEQRKFGGKLPRGTNLFQAISNSFNSPKNVTVAQNFKDRIKTELNVQGQLAGMAGRELVDLRSRISKEKNPQARLALTDEFHKISKDVNHGKLPISPNQTQVKQVLERFKQEQDPRKLQGIQKELAQLTKAEAPRTSELLNQKNLATLKQDIAKFPNPQMRSNLETQVGQLQQSVEATKAAELNREKIDSITAQAAQESNPQKRNELLGQIKELAKPAAGAAGLAGGLNLLERRQALESQLSLEQDKQKRAALEKALEEQRKHQAESLRQQLDRGKPAEPKLPGQERLKQTDQVRQQELERQKLLQQQEFQKQQELQKRQGEQKHLEEERLKQTDRVRQQQLEQQKLLQGKELQKQKQEELQKQTEQKRPQEQIEKQKQLDQQKLLRQQEEQGRRQIEADRLKKLEQQRFQEQAEQSRRKQLEAETLRKQQEKSLQLQKQQEQNLQLRKQQEQTEQMRRQQQQMEQQKQLQQQQLQQQHQQQLQQQQRMLQQQQLQQQQLQQQQLRQQQMRQQQMPQQQPPQLPGQPGPPIR